MYCELLPTLDQDITVLTASGRLGHHLQQQYAQHEAKSNKKRGSIPSILPLDEWISQCWRHCQQASEILLSDFQEHLLWQEIIPFSNKAANLVKEAWQLVKAWNLSLKDLEREANSEVQHFIQWALRFETQLKERRWISSAELPKRLESLIPYLKLPKQIILVGFNELVPSVRQFLEVLEKNAVPSCHSRESGNPEVRVSYFYSLLTSMTEKSQSIYRIHLKDQENEIQTMARWAHAQWVIDPAKKIGCIIPNLAHHRSQVLRLFTEVFHSDKPFNISLGEPLTHIPLIKTALDILELNYSSIDIIPLGVVLRSAYINSTDDDACLAAMLDVKLRQLNPWQISPQTLMCHLSQLKSHFQYSTLNTRCQQWLNIERPITPKYPSTWAQQFTAELLALGWLGQRTLNTKEYQQQERWRQLLEEFAALDMTTQPCTRKTALHLLRQLAHHTIFQPKTETAPIQILGLLEAAGENFDKVWMMDLNDKNWPPSPKPNPFLPLNIQRRHQMPHSSVKREIDYTIQLQQRLLNSAPTVILSAALQEGGDLQLSPSPLIRQFPLITPEELELPPFQTFNERMFNAKKIERIVDQTIPLQNNEPIRGGSSLLQSQSVCPFQAFAKIRLQAKPLKEPHPGLSGAERGDFVHRLLDLVWKKIKDWHTLNNYSDQELETLIDETIDHFFKQKPSQSIFIRIEKKRIKQLIKKWLALEKKREPFVVTQRETARHIKIGPLNLQVRIDRIDTIGNNQFVIDYKISNKNSPDGWLGDRLKHIQLPLYCTFAVRNVKGMAYAEVHSKKMKFNGLIDPQEKPLFRDITVSPEPWDTLTQKWKILLHQLAVDFSKGKADVNPLDAKTCKYCELSTLCRIGETDD